MTTAAGTWRTKRGQRGRVEGGSHVKTGSVLKLRAYNEKCSRADSLPGRRQGPLISKMDLSPLKSHARSPSASRLSESLEEVTGVMSAYPFYCAALLLQKNAALTS